MSNDKIIQIANLITELTYSEMISIAEDLYRKNEDPTVWNLNRGKEYWAAMLADWAIFTMENS